MLMTTSSESKIAPESPSELPGEKKIRIAQPPYLHLDEAIRLAGQIYEQGGGIANVNLLTSLLKNSPSSSSFLRKLMSMRGYRLTSSVAPPVSLTEIGLAIVAPKDEASRLLNLKLAAIGPEPFRRTYERLKGKLLPQDEYLRNTFQYDMQLPKVVADAWVDSFKSSLETAGLLLARSDGKTQILEGSFSVESEAKAQDDRGDDKIQPSEPSLAKEKAVPDHGEGHTTKITLADGRLATIFIPDRLTQRDATRLKGALAGISAIIESMVDEGN
jgi:hypothetical protein